MGKVNGAVYTGTKGKVYIDGVLEYYIKEINVKATGEFDDLDCCGDTLKGHTYIGYDIEGNMTAYKTHADYDDEILDDFDNGIMRERKIVTELTNMNTGKTISYSIPNVVFTEVTPVDFGRKTITYSIPFKCGKPKRLDK